jgi:hypothetical protein
MGLLTLPAFGEPMIRTQLSHGSLLATTHPKELCSQEASVHDAVVGNGAATAPGQELAHETCR